MNKIEIFGQRTTSSQSEIPWKKFVKEGINSRETIKGALGICKWDRFDRARGGRKRNIREFRPRFRSRFRLAAPRNRLSRQEQSRRVEQTRDPFLENPPTTLVPWQTPRFLDIFHRATSSQPLHESADSHGKDKGRHPRMEERWGRRIALCWMTTRSSATIVDRESRARWNSKWRDIAASSFR